VKSKTFIEMCVNSERTDDDVDSFVEAWHTSGDKRSLRESLGLSAEEYADWVARPESIATIVDARRRSSLLARA
jgi:hypothetical protein